MESKDPNLITIECRMVVEWWLPGAEGWGKWGDSGQSLQISML